MRRSSLRSSLRKSVRKSRSPTPPTPLTVVATFNLDKTIQLVIAKGSVVEFGAEEKSSDSTEFIFSNENDSSRRETKTKPERPIRAIVNAANESCLGGGGVDGAISAAGGPTLVHDRRELPVLPSPPATRRRSLSGNGSNYEIRCRTGDAKVTGPGSYGSLHVPYVIHAVGPNYRYFSDMEEADELLKSAYRASLKSCCIYQRPRRPKDPPSNASSPVPPSTSKAKSRVGKENSKQSSSSSQQQQQQQQQQDGVSSPTCEQRQDQETGEASPNNAKKSSEDESMQGTFLSALLQEVQTKQSPKRDNSKPATAAVHPDNNNNNNKKLASTDLIDEKPKIQEVAFSLLSAGVYRGRRDLHTILQLGVTTIRDWVKDPSNDSGSLERIILCAFDTQELDILVDVCVKELL